ncbi:MAG: sodium-dependent transporter [Candidatus Eutrophobiaceae bacterium]
MQEQRKYIHGQWSSRWAFILVSTGAAVGLGNIWKFSYEMGERGGAVFVMVYLLCVAFIGVPLLMSEILMGRHGRRNLLSTMRNLAEESGLSRHWDLFGWSMIVGSLLILSFYSVIAGWSMAYIFRVGSGIFSGQDAEFSEQVFANLVSSPEIMLAWHTIFMCISMVVVSLGVRSGLEKTVVILTPMLLILLLIMVGYAISTEGFSEAVTYMFKPDWSVLAEPGAFSEVVMPAVGHAFFTLSLGMGSIMIYGSYLSEKISIAKTSMVIAGLDTAVALLAGLAIYPLVFTYGLDPASGPGLLFITLPVAFGQIPLGELLGTLFFILVMIAAWSSGISLLEPTVNLLIERFNHTRLKATLFTGSLVWMLGIFTVLSFNHWKFEFNFLGQHRDTGIFDILDVLITNIMLPLHALIIAVFVGWMMKRTLCKEELHLREGFLFKMWHVTIRYVTPVGIVLFFLSAFFG